MITGCSRGDKDKPPDKVAVTEVEKDTPPSVRGKFMPYRSLLDEVVRAELDTGGLLIDFGTPDQHKFTRGAWRTGWGKSGEQGATNWLALSSRQGWLEVMAPAEPPNAIVVRARSRTANQRLTFLIEGKALGTAEIGSDWTVARVPIDAGAVPTTGRFRLEVRSAAGATKDSRADLDWVWLAREAGEPTVSPRALPLTIGGKLRRTIAAPNQRTYSFYLSPPPKAHLVVDLGASGAAQFTVSAVVDGKPRAQLLRERVEGSWREHAIPLGEYAGRAVRIDLTTNHQTGAAGWGEPELMIEAAAATPVAKGGAAPKNVIVLVMDTARADAFGPFAGKDRVVKTPVFDAYAARSTVFTAAYDNENWTKPSVATTLTGLYPSTHTAKKDDSKLPDEVELLSQRLKRDGFATAGFVANGYVSDKFGFDKGWDTFKNYIRESKPSEAEHVFGDALAWLDAHDKQSPNKPFFLYLQTIDPHVVYRADEQYWRPYFEGSYDGPLGPTIDAEDQVKLSTKKIPVTDRDVSWLKALYFAEVAYHDEHLGRFFTELATRGHEEDTLVLITNDHGEELGERGRFGHGHQVYEELVRAPLVVHYPPLFPPGKVVSDIVEHVDVAPTVLDALGRDPLANADGHSFLPLVRGQNIRQPRYALIEFLDGRRVLRVGTWKLIAGAGGDASLYDLGADPGETKKLGETAPVVRRLCEVHLGEALAVPDKATRMQALGGRRQYQAGAANIDPKMRRQLEALGYFGGTPKDSHATP